MNELMDNYALIKKTLTKHWISVTKLSRRLGLTKGTIRNHLNLMFENDEVERKRIHYQMYEWRLKI